MDALNTMTIDVDGTPMSAHEVSLYDVAVAGGMTDEDLKQFELGDWDFGETILTHTPFSHIVAEYARYFAQTLYAPRVRFGEMHIPADADTNAPLGYAAIARTLADDFTAAGGRLFVNTKVIGIFDDHDDDDDDDMIVVLKNGARVKTERVFLNIPTAAVQSLGEASLPWSEMGDSALTALSRAEPAHLTKCYLFFEDAFWRWPTFNDAITGDGDLRLYSGRARTDGHNTQIRYHDGSVACGGSHRKRLADVDGDGECRGALLASYNLRGAGTAGDGTLYTSSYTSATGTFVDGEPFTTVSFAECDEAEAAGGALSPACRGARRMRDLFIAHHQELLAEVGKEDVVLPQPTHAVMSSFHKNGPVIAGTPNLSPFDYNLLMTKPVAGRNIHFANTDQGDVPGWLEGSLRVVERTLYHHMGLAAPEWLESVYHDGVIAKLNAGSTDPSARPNAHQ